MITQHLGVFLRERAHLKYTNIYKLKFDTLKNKNMAGPKSVHTWYKKNQLTQVVLDVEISEKSIHKNSAFRKSVLADGCPSRFM